MKSTDKNNPGFKMFQIFRVLFIIFLLHSRVNAQKSQIDKSENSEQPRQIEIDELVKYFEALNDEVGSKESNEEKEQSQQKPLIDVLVPENVGILSNIEKDQADRNVKIPLIDPDLENRERLDKRKISENDDVLNELLKESYDMLDRTELLKNPANNMHLTESQKEELHYYTLLRLQNLYESYGKHKYNNLSGRTNRASRYDELLDKRMEQIQARLDRLMEKKRQREQKSQSGDKSDAEVTSNSSVTTYNSVNDVDSGEISEEIDTKSRAANVYSYEDYEKKVMMDAAVEDAADMIRKLSQNTRGFPGNWNDQEFENQVLGLAVDLVNKVSASMAGDEENRYDLFVGSKYKSGDGYLKAVHYDDDEAHDPILTNKGFDFIEQSDSGDYVGQPGPFSRGRCDNCDKYNGKKELAFQGRKKRLSDEDTERIHHLEQLNARSSYSGVWYDVNKLYNFKDFENDKFIDLSMNCTDDSTQPDCQRLQYKLVTSKDGEPVPLWFVKDYLSHGRDLAVDMQQRAHGLQSANGLHPAPHSPSMLHFIHNRASDSNIKLNEESQIVLFGVKVLQEKLLSEYNLTPNTFLEFLEHHGFRVTGSQVCRDRHKRCNRSSKYRSIDGSCNNFRNPSWGKSNTAFVRVLPARYADGIHALAGSASGGPLPNPRALSAQLFSRRNTSDTVYTLGLAQWGQMLAHDFARQVIDQTASGGIECCDSRGPGPLPKSLQHHSCSPIVIPSNDDFYSRYNQTCMNFVRSMTVAREDCSLGPANQLNGVSSFLDLSPVYGPDQYTSDSLRELQGGRMRSAKRGNRAMMPAGTRSGLCDARTSYDVCYETGDIRTNQNPQLVVLHTLMIREHNRIAYELSALNPHWNDERLFQETRRIVIAEYQHITYRHWLPLLLGRRYCIEHGICPEHNELSNDYDVRINPSVINGFTAGAFRFLHSLIEGTLNLVADNYGTSGTLRLSNHYFRPQIIEPDKNFESLLRGLVHQAMQKPDPNFHTEISEYLFRSDNEYGLDLEAIDIQRGRDHGLPGYNAYRELCRLERAKDFHGLINEISLGNIERLQSIYEHVDDIDLLVGATLENKVAGSLLGPTLQCLIGEQFYRARVGDKYFYNNANFPHSFTPEQFEEIKKASFATLICDLGEAAYEVQLNPFKISSNKNPMISCFNLPKMNLEFWKEDVNYPE